MNLFFEEFTDNPLGKNPKNKTEFAQATVCRWMLKKEIYAKKLRGSIRIKNIEKPLEPLADVYLAAWHCIKYLSNIGYTHREYYSGFTFLLLILSEFAIVNIFDPNSVISRVSLIKNNLNNISVFCDQEKHPHTYFFFQQNIKILHQNPEDFKALLKAIEKLYSF